MFLKITILENCWNPSSTFQGKKYLKYWLYNDDCGNNEHEPTIADIIFWNFAIF